jgi:hypothetical protein
MTTRLLAVVLLLGSGIARAVECRLDGSAWIVGQVNDGPLSRAVDARRGETVHAYVVFPGTVGGRKVLFSDAPDRRYAKFGAAGCGEAQVSWRRVEPTMMHTTTPPPNADEKTYSNAILFGARHGEWIGWDKIEYFESPLDGGGMARDFTDAHPSNALLDNHDGLGVMRLAATVQTASGGRAETPGARNYDGPGISDRVFRYSVRSGDDFLGWLSAWFNVPYLFGSAGHKAKAQAERYIGADCADVLTAAMRRAGRRDLDYTSVADLIKVGKRIAGPVLVDGTEGAAVPDKRLAWGSDVQPGDLLVINYVGWDGTPREWDHVLVAVEDRGIGGAPPDGLFGPEDLVADSGDATGLIVQPLARQGKVELLVQRVPMSR